ncbi:Gfo/Idh/MocA family oxidoreductase [Paenibacillus filicis]|uniref:Gfo/Idh/MocA family oxidoreductase n=1 Tax=Paenibacillus gyeongsangnamensis TaxID=3388067 RepID=A0ABT4QF27_9BACL|nr:Gfo/Idh/MocA family oxidoreductase [Paenibacillus filicis]MCZ8515484.1 Gfo/Idh/MocA family oxidoreductase [Paenibacillus filicis]
MKRLNIGVVGLGEVAQIIHLPILEMLSGQYKIAALCDISPQLLEAIGERYGVNQRYTDAHQLAAQQDLDAVFVLNSDEYHAECAIAALKNKKHVLIEKPMALNQADADAIIEARDEAKVQVMVGYMRRFAPAYVRAVEEVKNLEKIRYARVRDIIGQNRLIIEQSSNVLRFNDIPEEAIRDRLKRAKNMVSEAIGEAPPELVSAYRLLCGLSSHDISAMREIIGVPNRIKAAAEWNGGRYISAILEYDDFYTTFETGVDNQRRFDAHIEVYSPAKSIKVQYDTPYIRHLPTHLIVSETKGDAYLESVIRPTFKDPYTHEIEYFYDVVTNGLKPKTTPEDFKEDLSIFQEIIDVLR